ncbi:hypothetical protein ADIAL_1458 [Alkalibacterium sp. AK22]|uniref:hypothetical protein n=1 Tax=Alkalibacterium sp. AK22 TaxID=1229520 RepID=UPI00044B9BD2|nr:hypothetical protein [Alkalibacterium sp. AK22]EXJ23101.1 hypothetical protein ADIAL_1458 [Alkalibacterium sp. AK22]
MSEETLYTIRLPKDEISLNALLKGYTKTKLKAIGEGHGLMISSSWTKEKQVDRLTPAIIKQAQTIYQEVLEEVVRTLVTGEERIFELEHLDAVRGLFPLFQKGFLFAAKTNKSVLLVIPEEVAEAVKHKQHLSAEPRADDLDGQHKRQAEMPPSHQLLREWRDRLVKIYGTCSPDHLEKVWNRFYPDKLSATEVQAILSE